MSKIPGKVERAEGLVRLPFWIWYVHPPSTVFRRVPYVVTSVIRNGPPFKGRQRALGILPL